MINDATGQGRVAVVIDMTASGTRLLIGVAARRGIAFGYVTGLQMRRAAQRDTASGPA